MKLCQDFYYAQCNLSLLYNFGTFNIPYPYLNFTVRIPHFVLYNLRLYSTVFTPGIKLTSHDI